MQMRNGLKNEALPFLLEFSHSLISVMIVIMNSVFFFGVSLSVSSGLFTALLAGEFTSFLGALLEGDPALRVWMGFTD